MSFKSVRVRHSLVDYIAMSFGLSKSSSSPHPVCSKALMRTPRAQTTRDREGSKGERQWR